MYLIDGSKITPVDDPHKEEVRKQSEELRKRRAEGIRRYAEKYGGFQKFCILCDHCHVSVKESPCLECYDTLHKPNYTRSV